LHSGPHDPCKPDRTPDFDVLVRKGKELIAKGMSAVVYCGSMGRLAASLG
jgi:dihydrodipicolinate synthase/N-acetylneuraminate lyase